jgi:hypothetical protein
MELLKQLNNLKRMINNNCLTYKLTKERITNEIQNGRRQPKQKQTTAVIMKK